MEGFTKRPRNSKQWLECIMEEYRIIVVEEKEINRGLDDSQLAKLSKANHVVMRKKDKTCVPLKDKWKSLNHQTVTIYLPEKKEL